MDDEQVQAKIAALASQINHAKQRQQQIALAGNVAHHNHPSRLSRHTRGAAHWTPYGRGGGSGYRAGFQNRTLVLGGKIGNPVADDAHDSGSDSSAFVSNRRAGTKSIMSKDTFERQQKQKTEYQEAIPVPRRQDYKDSTKDNAKFSRTLLIDNIEFEVNHNGSKLLRVSGPNTAALETPKKWTQGPVTFLRSKHGNLIKATAPTQRPTPKKQCEKFTRYGSCARGLSCRDAHDPAKVAYCRDLLQHGKCSSEDACDMSHDKTYHRVPACTFFLRGNCTNSACRYVHVDVHPSPTRVCSSFAHLGFCAKSTDCDKRHVFECPAYAEKRHCADHEKGTCQLPHTEHAVTLRKAARRQAKMASDDASDLSSTEEENNEGSDEEAEYDSDVIITDADHELTQQQDYVPFV
ncbi:hypothetical protein DOTSEDRAFT_40495 [Dothistroma septosporum NZE10]|uniref:C3H1-type domain-containing protein n=1 Tax=Dothistroma septosporum (strain NZE10 / CBS 128990) TaxID=675120 RepID=N1Q430_DOTSN|nr:hypothetical protein DOTSEDRAFT_40495 [Dothistroma septosporum NZE10]